jgi:hypothetical protein
MNLSKSLNGQPYIAFVFFIFLQTAQLNSKAQIATSSPYSRYGIGDITGKGLSQAFALGGSNIALQNDTTPVFFINSGNPASYSNIRLTTAELGVNFSRLQLQSQSTQKSINNASVGYITLAFPFKKWWGASAGLTPYSSVGYNVREQQTITNVGNVDFLYQGNGGINQAYFGNGIKPFYELPMLFMKSKKYQRLKEEKKDSIIYRILKRKKSLQSLSLGVNASYLFGSISHEQRSIFPLNANAYNTYTSSTTRVGDIYLDYGAQYAYTIDSLKGRDLKENVQILVGATYAAQTNINTKIDSLSYTYSLDALSIPHYKDSITNTEGKKGKVPLPLSFGFGLGLKKGDQWLITSDFAIQNWSSLVIFNQPQGLKNSMRFSFGAQFIPNSKASGKGSFLKRVNYRIGARYLQSSIVVKQKQLIENAISFGLGLPVGRNFLLQNFSMVNIGVEIGQRGTTANGLIKEQFVRALLGFTINDKWFIKPKYD